VDWEEGKTDPYMFYESVITSYDYDCPISEAGDYGQPGVGGANKFQVQRACSRMTDSAVWQVRVYFSLCHLCHMAKAAQLPQSDARPSHTNMGHAQAIRDAIEAQTGVKAPTPPPRPRIVAYGTVNLTQQATLFSQLDVLAPGTGAYADAPLPMEEYGQR
jgi:beta-galactosidase